MITASRNLSVRSWIACGLLGGFGLSFLLGAQSYDMGTLRAMGPGYFPALLGVTLCAIALLVVIEDAVTGGRPPALLARVTCRTARSVICPLAGVMAFALTIRNAGLAPATILCVLIAGFAHPGNRVIEIALIALLVSTLSAVVFVFTLGIPVRLFPF